MSRFLFHVHSRRGLGHLMRARNIAIEIQKLQKSAEISFFTNHNSAIEINASEFETLIERSPKPASWQKALALLRPHVVIYDTLLPENSNTASSRNVLILRKCKKEKQKDIFSNPFTGKLDLLLIPHSAAEFGCRIPSYLQTKSFFVGPIVRKADEKLQTRLKKKYDISKDDFLLVSTPGGGGFEDANAFFQKCFHVHQHLLSLIPDFRHLVIQGPNFTGRLRPLEKMSMVHFEPDLFGLFVISNLVIAQGGYNTVHEIRAAKVPAVFLPAARTYDNQLERVRSLERKGVCVVIRKDSSERVAQRVAKISDRQSLQEMKRNYSNDRFRRGNRAAAEKIIRLATS